MRFFDVRRARVRSEYAPLYPEISAGVWVHARKAARWVWVAETKRPREHACTRGRLMCDVHFEFHGRARNTGLWLPRTPRRFATIERHQLYTAPSPTATVVALARVLTGMAEYYPSLSAGNWYPVLIHSREALKPSAREGYIWINVNGRPRHVWAAHFEFREGSARAIDPSSGSGDLPTM